MINVNDYNDWRQTYIENLIKYNIITLHEDHSDLNLHFTYKNTEVTSYLNAPYPYYPVKLIDTEPDDYEYYNEDFYRTVFIAMDINTMLDEDSDDEDEEEEDIIADANEEDSYETFEDRLRRHFPGLYLTDKQLKGYDSANNKKELLHNIMMDEEYSIFAFSSIRGLKLDDNGITFTIPFLSKPPKEWMFYCCVVIDKVLKYFTDNDDEYDDEDLLDEEWTNE